jgi:TP53 regulating kinase-like protein
MQYLGRTTIVKERFVKKYRHPILDQRLSNKRLAQEARCMARASKSGIDVPTVYLVDLEARRLFIEYVEGSQVKSLLFSGTLQAEGENSVQTNLE